MLHSALLAKLVPFWMVVSNFAIDSTPTTRVFRRIAEPVVSRFPDSVPNQLLKVVDTLDETSQDIFENNSNGANTSSDDSNNLLGLLRESSLLCVTVQFAHACVVKANKLSDDRTQLSRPEIVSQMRSAADDHISCTSLTYSISVCCSLLELKHRLESLGEFSTC